MGNKINYWQCVFFLLLTLLFLSLHYTSDEFNFPLECKQLLRLSVATVIAYNLIVNDVLSSVCEFIGSTERRKVMH